MSSRADPGACCCSNGPQGIRGGSRTSDGAFVFVMQNNPLGVLVGARGGPAAGYMQIGAP